jgi:hypothetical protein
MHPALFASSCHRALGIFGHHSSFRVVFNNIFDQHLI